MIDTKLLFYKGNLEITTKVGCYNMCEYCPQLLLINKYKEVKNKKIEKNDRFMSFENFKKFVDTIPTTIAMHFTGYVEPFDNPECEKFILHVANKGHKVSVNTTLEGMSIEQYEKIKNINYKDFQIHLPSKKYFENIGVKVPRKKDKNGVLELKDKWVKLLKHICRNQPNVLKLHSHGGCNENAVQIIQELISEGALTSKNNISIEKSRENSRSQNKGKNSRETRVKIPPEYNIRGKCVRVYQSVLLPDGKLALCCQDYGLEHIVGDLSKQSWEDFRSSSDFLKLVEEGADLCDYCDRAVPTNTYTETIKV